MQNENAEHGIGGADLCPWIAKHQNTWTSIRKWHQVVSFNVRTCFSFWWILLLWSEEVVSRTMLFIRHSYNVITFTWCSLSIFLRAFTFIQRLHHFNTWFGDYFSFSFSFGIWYIAFSCHLTKLICYLNLIIVSCCIFGLVKNIDCHECAHSAVSFGRFHKIVISIVSQFFMQKFDDIHSSVIFFFFNF